MFGRFLIASIPAMANRALFDVNATVEEKLGGRTDIYTGYTVSGLLDLDTVSGAVNSINFVVSNGVDTDPPPFTGFFGCPGSCTFVFNKGFNEFGLVDIGNPVGYTGGSLASDFYIALTTSLWDC